MVEAEQLVSGHIAPWVYAGLAAKGGVPGSGNSRKFFQRLRERLRVLRERIQKIRRGDKSSIAFNEKVSAQKQLRHLKGKAPTNKSYLNSLDDAQAVLDAYHQGNYRLISQNPAQNTVTIEVKGITGTYINVGSPKGLPDLKLPTNKFMIQSTKAPKVVPVNPNK